MPNKQGKRQIQTISQPIPFKGSSFTAKQKALVPHGQFSMVQNMRSRHPGFEDRKGFAAKHTTNDGTNKVLSLYQFCKGKRTERHFYAQMSDDDILKATDNPPTVTTGAFGGEAWSGSANSIPASWSNVEELCLLSNGVDQHQICAGTANYVKKFIKFSKDAAAPDIPEDGIDYTQEVTDGNATTHAILDSLDTYAAATYECLFICTLVPANKLTWTFITGHENDTAATGTLSYRKNDNTWHDTGETDLTSKGTTDTLGQNGSMTWSQPTDEIPCYMFGICGFWYRWETDTQLDAEVEVSSLTYGTDGTAAKHFESIVNVWTGWPPYAIEARFQQDTGEPFETYGSDTIEIDSMTTNGKVYFNSYDPIMGIYIDPGETPNTTASTTIDAVYYWNGSAWTTVGTVTDGTDGMSKAGWVTWAKTSDQPMQFDTSRYYSYWYYFEVDQDLSDNVIISIETMPYFDVNEVGRIGYVNAAWKGRAVYNFGDQYGFVSAKNNPLVLNGDDYGIIEAGDGRTNRWSCARQFHNELLVWQEEKGKDGGTLTLFEGDQPKNFGKLLLSSRLGSVNAKSAVVVDGVLTSTRTDEVVKTLAFWISRYGFCVTDGRTCSIFSDDIANYFDPKETSTCIRKGYENEHWLEYDSSDGVLRAGLVCGATATTPNVFPVFDLVDKSWSFDVLGQNMSCMTEVEAASGNLPVLQYAGGTDDGGIYRLNTGTDDIDIGGTTTKVDSYVMLELNQGGIWMTLRELLLMVKVQAAGNITVTPYINNVAQTAITLSMLAEATGDAARKHRFGVNLQGINISLKIQNATLAQSIYLLTWAAELYEKEGH